MFNFPIKLEKICLSTMYVDFMINDSLQPDAMQIVLQKTLKLSALINISAPKQIKDRKKKLKKAESFITPAIVGFEFCELISLPCFIN